MFDNTSLSALYQQDPRLAQAIRQRMMAERLMTQASDASPIDSPWQGVSRLVSGLVGGLQAREADDSLKAQGDAQSAAAARRNAEYDDVTRGYATGLGGRPQPSGMSQALAGQPALTQPSGQPPGFNAVLQNESGGSMAPNIWGDGGRSAGPAQVQQGALDDVNRARGTSYTLGDLARNPQLGAQVGQAYYSMLLDRYGGDVAKAQAAYNAGMGRVDQAVAANGAGWRAGIPNSTQGYLDRAGNGAAPQQPDYAAAVAAGNAKIAQANQLSVMAAEDANSTNPAVRRQAQIRMEQARMLAAQGQHEVQTATSLANRNMNTTVARGPDGKNYLYEVTPQGLGRQVALAPEQPDEKNIPTGFRVKQDGTGIEPIPGAPAVDMNPAGSADETAKFTRADKLRDEYQKLTAPFVGVQTSLHSLKDAAASNSAAGDFSMLYQFNKMMDPNSVVRESEFAAAAASGSLGDRMAGAMNRVLSGERLTESQREDFIKQAEMINEIYGKNHDAALAQYKDLAEKFKLDPSTVVQNYRRPYAPNSAARMPEIPIAGKTEADRINSGDWRPSEPGEGAKTPPLPPGVRRVK